MIVSMIWKSYELSVSHFIRATAIFVVDCCQFGPSCVFGLKIELMASADLVGGTTEKVVFFWPYMIVSMIRNTYDLSASHLIHDTAIFVVDCCQFGPSSIFGLKMEIMACASLVGGTKEQSYLSPWPHKIVSMIWNTYTLSTSHLSHATTILVIDSCQFCWKGILGLKMGLMVCAGLVGFWT